LEPEADETFFPQFSELVPASAPHPPGTSYKVSIGLENWGLNFLPGFKIQMFSNGRLTEQSPSFPLGTRDHQNVTQAMVDLLEKHRTAQQQRDW